MTTLSPLARAEIEASLEACPDDLTRVSEALIALLGGLPPQIEPAFVISAFDAVLRRHVAPRQPDEGLVALEVIGGIRELLVQAAGDATTNPDDYVMILKAFPPISDAGVREFFAAFFAFMAAGGSRQEDAAALCRRLQLAKATGQALSLARLERIFEWVL